MENFLNYDQFRLFQYKKRKEHIDFGETNSYYYYRFDEVDYFNYIFFKTPSYNSKELLDLLSKYQLNGKKSVKLIFPLLYKKKLAALFDDNNSFREIACVKRDSFIVDKSNRLLPIKNWKELLLFTEIYLKGFESKNKDIEEVSSNFKYLMDSNKVDFFFIPFKNKIAGVCANYYGEKNIFLAACSILENYRNIGLQKDAIENRIFIGQEKGYSIFTSWAYKNSISHQNLLKSNFLNYSFYLECLSKPLSSFL